MVLLGGLRVEVKKTALPGERSAVVCSYPDPSLRVKQRGLEQAGSDAGTDDRTAAVGVTGRC